MHDLQRLIYPTVPETPSPNHPNPHVILYYEGPGLDVRLMSISAAFGTTLRLDSDNDWRQTLRIWHSPLSDLVTVDRYLRNENQCRLASPAVMLASESTARLRDHRHDAADFSCWSRQRYLA